MNIKRTDWIGYPDHQMKIVDMESIISIVFEDKIVASSKNVLFLYEENFSPVHYFPKEDVRMELLFKTKKVTFCPFKGEAEHWALTLQNRIIEVAAWSYPNPYEQVSEIKNFIAFYPEIIKHINFN